MGRPGCRAGQDGDAVGMSLRFGSLFPGVGRGKGGFAIQFGIVERMRDHQGF